MPGLVSTLCAAYVLLVADLVLVALALSPPRLARQGELAALQAAVLVASCAWWWRRGRPRPELAGARAALGTLVRSPLALGFAALIAAALGYELLLALGVPPNNWDSLVYHLARVAGWVQAGGWRWIPDAPSNILNTRQPVAEQEIFFLFASTRSTVLYALPQLAAQLAILLAVYGAARRLGYGVSPAVCAAGLFSTFSLVALESATAQNDLVAASFPAVAACLVLGGSAGEFVLAGAALGAGAGVKLTTVLVWPVVIALAARRGRRALALGGLGLLGGALAVGWWGYLLNTVHTGHPLGQGAFSLDVSVSPSFPGSLHTSVHLLYRLFDLSALSGREIRWLAYLGDLALVAGAVHGYRRGGLRRAVVEGVCLSLPFYAPYLVIGGSDAVAAVARLVGLPVRISGFAGGLDRRANEDYSAFGPLGALALLGVPIVVVAAFLTRRANADKLALALSLPLFLLLLGLTAAYNPYLTRFVLVPAALTAPLLAVLFRSAAVGAALLAVAAATAYVTLTHDSSKPLAARPWKLDQAQVMDYAAEPANGPALAAYDRLVPAGACVGAVVGPDDPAYLLYGPALSRRVVYLPPGAGPAAARRDRVAYVVATGGAGPGALEAFGGAGWRTASLAGAWELARDPHPAARAGGCAGR